MLAFTMRCIFAGLLTTFLCATAHAQAIADGYYWGELRGDEVSELGFELRGETLHLDLVSQWSLGNALVAEREPDVLAFDLPFGLGHAVLHTQGTGLAGILTRPDGRTGTLVLRAVPAPAVRLEELVFANGDVRLAATLGLPEGPGPHAALILVPGGGDSERGQASTRFLAQFLPRLGFACLVYDKRGSGASSGNWREVGFTELANDALAAVTALSARTDIERRAVGFFAASQGTWVALEACTRADAGVAFLVNHSGPAVTLLEADTFAVRSSARAAGLTESELEELNALWELECAALRLGVAPDQHAPLVEAIRAASTRPWFARQPYQASPADSEWVRWYPRVMASDPGPALQRLELPMLWLYGASDTQSDVARNVEHLSVLARDARKPWSLHVFPRGNHGISVPIWSGVNDGPATMAGGYFETLRGWLEREVARALASGSRPASSGGR